MNEWMFNDTPGHENQIGYWVSEKGIFNAVGKY